MKTLKLLAFAVSIISLISSCAEQGETLPDTDLVEFVAVTIPDAYKATCADIEEATDISDLIVDVVLTTEQGEDVYGQVHLVAVGGSKLSLFEVSPNILHENDWANSFLREGFDSKVLSKEESCTDVCKKNYLDEEGNKLPGYNECVADCWVIPGVAVAVIVLAVKEAIELLTER